MVAPLSTLINDDCTSEYAQQILAGIPNLKELPVNEYTKLLLSNLKTKVLPNENPQLPLDPETLIQGLKFGQKGCQPPHPEDISGFIKHLQNISPHPRTKKQTPWNPLTHWKVAMTS